MAHFARIKNGVVHDVIVVNNIELEDNGVESEAKGIEFCKSILGEDSEWVQTSYNGNLVSGVDRGPFACVGFTWDGEKFIPPVSEEVIEL